MWRFEAGLKVMAVRRQHCLRLLRTYRDAIVVSVSYEPQCSTAGRLDWGLLSAFSTVARRTGVLAGLGCLIVGRRTRGLETVAVLYVGRK